MTDGRTVWWAKDSGWWRRERIIELAADHGPAGPAVIDWLSCEAKSQNAGGVVKTGYRAIAHGTFVDVVTVSHVVSTAVQLGLLDDFEDADRTFTCRISGWHAEQERVLAAQRKAAQRAREKAESAMNTEDPDGDGPGQGVTSHGGSRDVPGSHLQDRTGQKNSTTPNPSKEGNDNVVELRLPARNTKRDRAQWEQACSSVGRRIFPELDTAFAAGVVRDAVTHLQAAGESVDDEAIRDWATRSRAYGPHLEEAS